MVFNLFRKKSDLEKAIERDGFENVITGFARVVSQKLHNHEIAYQFVLEEIEAASMGGAQAQAYARQSGIPPSEYKGSLANSRPEVDGPNGPQQMLLVLCMQLQANNDLMAKFRIGVLDKIMREYEFGIYATENEDDDEVFTPRTDTRLSHIATHLLNLSTSNLKLIGMKIEAEQCEELIQSCADQIPSEIFESFDTKVIAMMVMMIVAENGIAHGEGKGACMLAMSVIWGVIKMERESYSLTEKERTTTIQLVVEALALLEKHRSSLSEIPAKLWVAATLAEYA